MNKSKRVLITGGPSNEYIDEVMKITNMSSGKIAVQLAEKFSSAGWDVTVVLTNCVKDAVYGNIQKPNIKVIRYETTEELMRSIQLESVMFEYDVVIHSAAVADYKPEFSFRAEDMAAEIANCVETIGRSDGFNRSVLEDSILNILTNPKCKVDDDTKISSCEPNLTVKLGLTPKIIASLREMFPTSFICGFKLLENVAEDDLVSAAMSQIEKCKTNICFANDLAELRKGNALRLVVTKSGYNDIKVDGAEGIFNIVKIATEN